MTEPNLDYESGVLPVLQTKEHRRAYYNKIAAFYDRLAEKTEQPMRELGLEKLAAQPGERILEIGFGTGHCLVALAEAVSPDGKIHGIDLSEKMLEMTQELLEEKGLAERVELRRGDAEQLPYEDNFFNAIFMSFTLELFDTPEIPRVLRECRRVLKPGGRIGVVGISKQGKQGLVIKTFEWTHKHFPNLMDCRPIYIARALEANGFAVKDHTIEHMWVPVGIVLAVKE